MKNIFAAVLLLSALFEVQAQNFNGSINFKYYTLKDTSSNVYYVKDKIVKLDQFAKKGNAIEGSFIFNLNNNKILYVYPKRKIWGEHKSETPPVIKGTCEVSKGKNNKSLNGYKCKEYIVKNTEENTIITYWIASEKFSFFLPMAILMNRKDKQNIYFNQIKDLSAGSMPMLSEERSIKDGKLISKLEVTKINAKTPADASLEVPAAYNKFE